LSKLEIFGYAFLAILAIVSSLVAFFYIRFQKEEIRHNEFTTSQKIDEENIEDKANDYFAWETEKDLEYEREKKFYGVHFWEDEKLNEERILKIQEQLKKDKFVELTIFEIFLFNNHFDAPSVMKDGQFVFERDSFIDIINALVFDVEIIRETDKFMEQYTFAKRTKQIGVRELFYLMHNAAEVGFVNKKKDSNMFQAAYDKSSNEEFIDSSEADIELEIEDGQTKYVKKELIENFEVEETKTSFAEVEEQKEEKFHNPPDRLLVDLSWTKEKDKKHGEYYNLKISEELTIKKLDAWTVIPPPPKDNKENKSGGTRKFEKNLNSSVDEFDKSIKEKSETKVANSFSPSMLLEDNKEKNKQEKINKKNIENSSILFNLFSKARLFKDDGSKIFGSVDIDPILESEDDIKKIELQVYRKLYSEMKNVDIVKFLSFILNNNVVIKNKKYNTVFIERNSKYIDYDYFSYCVLMLFSSSDKLIKKTIDSTAKLEHIKYPSIAMNIFQKLFKAKFNKTELFYYNEDENIHSNLYFLNNNEEIIQTVCAKFNFEFLEIILSVDDELLNRFTNVKRVKKEQGKMLVREQDYKRLKLSDFKNSRIYK